MAARREGGGKGGIKKGEVEGIGWWMEKGRREGWNKERRVGGNETANGGREEG